MDNKILQRQNASYEKENKRVLIRQGSEERIDPNELAPTYTPSKVLEGLKSGETLSIAFGKISKAVTELVAHLTNTNNPHKVTKTQIGLENVDNTSDKNKPVSTAQLNAIKAAEQIGINAQKNLEQHSTSSDAHADIRKDVSNLDAGKVDKEKGKTLTTNDYTTQEKEKLSGIEAGATKTIVDAGLSESSTNPVQNRVIYEAIMKKANKQLDNLNELTANARTDIAYCPESNAVASSPFAGGLWHDVFAFLNGGQTISGHIVTENGTTWTSGKEAIKSLFIHKEASKLPILTSTIYSRMFMISPVLWSKIEWVELGVAYSSPFAKFTVKIEKSEDKNSWVTIHNSTISSAAAPYFLRIADLNGATYMRFTFTKVNASDTGSAYISCIKGLSKRKGDQGLGQEYEFPYQWNSHKDITPWTDSVQDLGSSSKKWRNIYADRIVGSVDNASKVNGHTVEADVPADAKFLVGNVDWEENDETSANFVKNRTHWKRVISKAAVILPATDITFKTEFGTISGIGTSNILEEQEYIVSWNNKQYVCTAFLANASICLGNASLIGAGADTGEPFAIEMITETYASIVKSTTIAESITIKIETKENIEYHKIAREYLPEPLQFGEVKVVDWNQLLKKEDSEDGEAWVFDAPLGLVAGDSYTITWNGETYEKIAKPFYINGDFCGIAIGNDELIDSGWGTGDISDILLLIVDVDTSIIEETGYQAVVYAFDINDDTAISVTRKSIIKLDNKYLDLDWLPKMVEVPLTGRHIVSDNAALDDLNVLDLYPGMTVKLYFDNSTYEAKLVGGEGDNIYYADFRIAYLYVGSIEKVTIVILNPDGNEHTISIHGYMPKHMPVDFLPKPTTVSIEDACLARSLIIKHGATVLDDKKDVVLWASDDSALKPFMGTIGSYGYKIKSERYTDMYGSDSLVSGMIINSEDVVAGKTLEIADKYNGAIVLKAVSKDKAQVDAADGKLTVYQNGEQIGTFTANQSNDTAINIVVPTKTSKLQNDSGFLTKHQDISGKVDKTGDTMSGTLTAPALKANNYFMSPTMVGEGDDTTYYHRVDFGKSGKNTVDFYEYGGVYNFYQNTTGKKDGSKLVASVQPDGFHGNLIGNASTASSVNWSNVKGRPSAQNSLESDSTVDYLTAAQGKVLAEKLKQYLPIAGGTLSGNLTGQYITGTWLRTTAISNIGANTGKIAVIDGSGWIYYRTPSQILDDIGAISKEHTHDYLPLTGGTLSGPLTVGGAKISEGDEAEIIGAKKKATLVENQLMLQKGAVFGGSAAEAGLVTRGICGVSTPDSNGACNKDNLYINYDGTNNYNANRQLVLQAGTAGEHYGSNLYQYAVPRGDAVKAWIEAQGYQKTKRTLVGQIGDNADDLAKPWFKVASCRIDATHEDKHIVFFSRETYERDFNGTLVCRVRTGADFIIELAQLYWLGDAFGVDFNNFVLAYKQNSGSVDFEIWCKISDAWTGYQFDVISEGRRVDTNECWTLTPPGLTYGGVAAIPSDYTQIASRPSYNAPQSGYETVKATANSKTVVNITFPYPMDHVPAVVTSFATSTSQSSYPLTLFASGRTTTGFKLEVLSTSSTTLTTYVSWIAV